MKSSTLYFLTAGSCCFLAGGSSVLGASGSALFEANVLSHGVVNAALFDYDSTGPNPEIGMSGYTQFSGDSTLGAGVASGLGSVSVAISGVGPHRSLFYVDNEISRETTTFFNEDGAKTGTLPAGLSYEIDEPGFTAGDIYDNLAAQTLDNGTFKIGAADSVTPPDDVAMAFGWEFSLLAGETAYLNYAVVESLTAVPTSYYLVQTDSDTGQSIYFYTTMDIRGTPPPGVIPEGSTVLGAASLSLLLGGAFWRRRQRAASTSV